MTIEYEVINGGSLVQATFYSKLTADDTIFYNKSIAANRDVKPGYNILFDWTRVTEFRINKTDISRIIESLAENPKNNGSSKIAVVSRPSVAFELGVLLDELQRNRERIKLIIFNNINTAKIWLGLA